MTARVSNPEDAVANSTLKGMDSMRTFTLPMAIGVSFLVVVTSMLAACGSDAEPAATWSGTIDTLPDGRVAVLSESPTWTEAARPVFEEELRVGSMMGEGPESFGQVSDLLLDEEGRIYVLESQAQEIRVFGPDGDWLHTIGRQGEGPGELKNAAAMGWGPDGVLRVVDYGNGRISDFRTDGTFLASHRQQGGFVMYPWPGEFGSDGRLINVSPSMRDGEFEAVLVRYTPAMEPADTLTIPRYEGDSEFFELASEGGGGIRASVPFGAGLSWDLDPRGYFWVAPNTATYEVSQVSFAGDTVLTIRRPSEARPVTAAEVDSAAATMKWFTDQGGKVDRSKFPSSKPALTRVFAPGDGHLYVVPVTDEFGSGYLSTSGVLDVFDSDGRYLGRLDLPEGMATSNPEPVFRGDHVLAVVRDELDVPYVVRYRLAPPGEVMREEVS